VVCHLSVEYMPIVLKNILLTVETVALKEKAKYTLVDLDTRYHMYRHSNKHSNGSSC